MEDIEQLKRELEKKTTNKGGRRTNSATKVVDAIQNIIVDTVIKESTEEIFEGIRPALEKIMLETYGCIPTVKEIKIGDRKSKVTGATHEKFETVLTMVAHNIPVYLTGRAGTGKNVLCQQIADALGLKFYFTNAVTQEYKLTGFKDAYGKFQETQFYKAFTEGGLFFLDEMDASIPEVLVILNAAIANRYFDFPCGRVDAHEDFRVIAAGNTKGTGADNNYTGRYMLDKASLDRFALVEIDYSPTIESALCNSNEELLLFTHSFRKATDKANVECLFSYRTISRIHELEDTDIPLKDVISYSLIKGLDLDDVNIIVENMKKEGMSSSNKYFDALLQIA